MLSFDKKSLKLFRHKKNITKEDKHMTLNELETENPKLYKAIMKTGHAKAYEKALEAGYEKALEEGLEQGIKEGVAEERKRILSISEWAKPVVNIATPKSKRMDAVIAATVKKAIASGADNTEVIVAIKQERERVEALENWIKRDAGKNEALNSIVDDAISSGKTEEDVRMRLTVAFFKYEPAGAGKGDSKAKKLLDRLVKYRDQATDPEREAMLTPADNAWVDRMLLKLCGDNRFSKMDPEREAQLTAKDNVEVARILEKISIEPEEE